MITFAIAKLESFQAVKKFFHMMGIYSPEQNPNSSFNAKMFIILLVLIISFIQTVGVLLFKAKTIFDYGIAFYASITILGAVTVDALIIWKRVYFFTITEKFDAFIGKSKRKFRLN